VEFDLVWLEYLQRCSICDSAKIFLMSIFQLFVLLKLKLKLQKGERLLIATHLDQSYYGGPLFLRHHVAYLWKDALKSCWASADDIHFVEEVLKSCWASADDIHFVEEVLKSCWASADDIDFVEEVLYHVELQLMTFILFKKLFIMYSVDFKTFEYRLPPIK
jgi:hypothetical protein